jgi:hypothetical protein
MNMGRLPSEDTNNNICHIFQRGNNWDILFESDKSKGMLIHILKEFKQKFDYEVFGFEENLFSTKLINKQMQGTWYLVPKFNDILII